MKRNSTIGRNSRSSRLAATLPEALGVLGVSDSEIARLTGVSRPTVARIRSRRSVRPDILLRVATAVLVLELQTTPASSVGADLRVA